MSNMQIERDLLASSSRLLTVATGLKKIVDGESPTLEGRERQELVRMAHLFGQIVCNSKYSIREEHPEFEMEATRLSPIFYRKLIELKVPFDRAYSQRVYQTLKSAGKRVALSAQELSQVQQVFQEMSDGIVSGLQYAPASSDVN